jgi:hypothetical protein
MSILEQGPWNTISFAQSAAGNIHIHDPSATIAVYLCNQKGVDPYGLNGYGLTNWQHEIHVALLQQAIVELELGED